MRMSSSQCMFEAFAVSSKAVHAFFLCTFLLESVQLHLYSNRFLFLTRLNGLCFFEAQVYKRMYVLIRGFGVVESCLEKVYVSEMIGCESCRQ